MCAIIVQMNHKYSMAVFLALLYIANGNVELANERTNERDEMARQPTNQPASKKMKAREKIRIEKQQRALQLCLYLHNLCRQHYPPLPIQEQHM